MFSWENQFSKSVNNTKVETPLASVQGAVDHLYPAIQSDRFFTTNALHSSSVHAFVLIGVQNKSWKSCNLSLTSQYFSVCMYSNSFKFKLTLKTTLHFAKAHVYAWFWVRLCRHMVSLEWSAPQGGLERATRCCRLFTLVGYSFVKISRHSFSLCISRKSCECLLCEAVPLYFRQILQFRMWTAKGAKHNEVFILGAWVLQLRVRCSPRKGHEECPWTSFRDLLWLHRSRYTSWLIMMRMLISMGSLINYFFPRYLKRARLVRE